VAGPEARLKALEGAPGLHRLAGTLRETPIVGGSASFPSELSVELRDLVRQARRLVREARPRQAAHQLERLAAAGVAPKDAE
jgi:hypothetical protein